MKNQPSLFFPRVRTKNHSSIGLRDRNNGLKFHKCRAVVRLGSTTELSTVYPKSYNTRRIVEINSIEGVKNSRSKFLMKQKFDEANISHAKWQTLDELLEENKLKYPIVLKRIFGYKGRGMHLINTKEELDNLLPSINNDDYIAEQFHTYVREYRLHCTKEGCFYTCRKMLQADAADRWYRNDSNCVWILENNPLFDKPSNFDQIEEQCIKALEAVGLDIGAFDVKVQSAAKENPKFIIIEVNSAPAFGEITLEKYKETINSLIENKINNYDN